MQVWSIVHLILVAFWGGVVAAEAVLEVLPIRRPALGGPTAMFHYYIDGLVELPVLVGVFGTGLVLAALAWPLTGWHWVKIACAAAAIAANVTCIVLVLRRGRAILALRGSGPEGPRPQGPSLAILTCAGVGLVPGLLAAGLGLWLAWQRLAGRG